MSTEIYTKCVMVVDTPHSPLATVARERSRTMKSDIVFATDFASPRSLLKFLIRQQYNQILFNWRGVIKEGSKTFFFRNTYLKLVTQAKVHALVPDYLGLNPQFVSEEEMLLQCVHGYWVTCKDLESKYQEKFPNNFPTGVLHDLPDVERIRKLRNLGHKSQGVIWVGNSRWGERYGYNDLKGYKQIVLPVKQALMASHPLLKFSIYDSAATRLDNKIILSEIANCRVLIQASESEGTGLPVLEALGLGVIPVTTKVGIAAELLTNEFSKFIVARNPDAFRNGIHEALEKEGAFSSTCIELFEKYIGMARIEKIHWNKTKLHYYWSKPKLAGSAKIWITWSLRHLRNRSSQHKSKLGVHHYLINEIL